MIINALILAGGFGSRLMKDINEDSSERFSHFDGNSKGLIPLPRESLPDLSADDPTIAGYWIEHLSRDQRICTMAIGSNAMHYPQFTAWKAATRRNVLLGHNQSRRDEDRQGTVKDWEYFAKEFQFHGPLVTVACDVLFYGFDLHQAIDFYESHGQHTVLGCYRTDDLTKKGVVSFDDNGRVTAFYETPQEVPAGFRDEGWRCAAFYILSEKANDILLEQFLDEKAAEAQEKKLSHHEARALYDAPGQFIQWLMQKETMYAYTKNSGRFDLGSLKDLEQVVRAEP